MGNNGKVITLMSVTLENGSISVNFDQKVNMALVSHALRLANLQLDNAIIAAEASKKSSIIAPPKGGITDRLRDFK